MRNRRRVIMFTSTLLLAGTGAASAASGLPVSMMVRELGAPAGAGTGEPNLVRGRDGLIYMTWIQKNPDTSHTLFVSRYDSAGWIPAKRVSAGKGWFVNWADFPALAVDERGAMLASWLEKSGGETYAYGVRLSRSRDAGRSWDSSFSPHNDQTETEHGFVSLTALPEGEFAAIWLDGREMVSPDGPMTLRYTAVDADGKLADESLIDPKVCDCCQTAAALCGDGSLVVAYRDRSDGEVRDISILRRTKNGWSKPASLHRDNWRIAGCPVNGPALDAFDRTVAAAWFTMGSDDSAKVYVAFSRDCGERFDAPVRVDIGQPLGRVDICLVDQSRACVVWLQPDGNQTKVMMRVVTNDGLMTNPVAVSRTSANRESGFPRIAFDGERLIVAWTDPAEGPRVRAAQIILE